MKCERVENSESATFFPVEEGATNGGKDVCVFTRCSALAPAVQLLVLGHRVLRIIDHSRGKISPWSSLSLCWVGYNLLGNSKANWMYLLKKQCPCFVLLPE